ncbi:5-methyltetrahydrofolate--homocysteine methyltransferase [Gammaproteobacteria bacterium]
MKKAVAYLEPFLAEEKSAAASQGRILLATVKGDVHDIGKNIVGVVLSCNGYEVIDLGVMVPAETILTTARERQVDIIGLSGLITPSLDEMVHLAREMSRRGFTVPLLIGGATTSKAHTAVKIEPHYPHGVVYVPDASRAAGVAAALLSPQQKPGYLEGVRSEYAAVRERRAGVSEARQRVTLAEARANPVTLPLDEVAPIPRLSKTAVAGLRVLPRIPLADLAPMIDWTFFFHAWELKGRYPQILDDPDKGEAARRLFSDAQVMLERIIAEEWLTARAVLGFFPANRAGDDILVYTDESRTQVQARFFCLRQQNRQPIGHANQCLADFIAPEGRPDYLGAFACTAGDGIEPWIHQFEAAHDDYSAILLKALADRLAEALAEYLHAQTRRHDWGYAPDESLDNAALIAEAYQGIRPAFGYPACPDHTEKDTLWRLLEVERHTGMQLTESRAMMPAASVSGLYFAHPKARYFTVGKLGRDQVADYAARKGMPLAEAERWLGPNLGYEVD